MYVEDMSSQANAFFSHIFTENTGLKSWKKNNKQPNLFVKA